MPLGSGSHHGKCDGIIDTGRIAAQHGGATGHGFWRYSF